MSVKISTVVENTNYSTLYPAADRWEKIAARTERDAGWETDPPRAELLTLKAEREQTAAICLRWAARAMKEAEDYAYSLVSTPF